MRTETGLLLVAATTAAGILAAWATGLGFERPWPLAGRPPQPILACLILALTLGVAGLRHSKISVLSVIAPLVALATIVLAVANRAHGPSGPLLMPMLTVADFAMLQATNPVPPPSSNWNLVAFTALGVGTLVSVVHSRWTRFVADLGALVAISIGVAAMAVHLLGLPSAVGVMGLYRTGPETALAMSVLGLSLGLVNGRWRGGAFGVLLSDGTAGWLGRRYMAATMFAPAIAIWISFGIVRIIGSEEAVVPALITTLLSLALGSSALSLVWRVDRVEREMRAAKETAEVAANRLKLALEAGSIGTWDTDLGTGDVRRSEALYKMYGMERQTPEVNSKYWPSAIHPDDRDRVLAIRSAVTPENPEYRSSHRIIRANDGVVRHVSVAARWLPEGSSSAGSLAGMVTDITDHVEGVHAAESTSRAKSRLIAGIGHDFGQPVQGLIIHLDILSAALASGPPISPDARRSLEASVEATSAVVKLTERMQALGRAGNALEPIRTSEMSVARRLRSLCREYEARAAANGITLGVRVSNDDALRATTDPVMFERILRNLVENAIKHTPSGGRILLSGRARKSGLLVEVWDTGRGIAEANLSAIWDDRRQVSPSDRGDGMGLATSQQLAVRIGCVLGATSKLGRGSRFWLRMPRETDAIAADAGSNSARIASPPATVVPDESRPSGGALRTVLLVEDSQTVIDALSLVMRRLGYSVVCAVDLAGAMNATRGMLAAGHMPDLIVSDYGLPDGDGPAVIRAVRKACRRPIPAMVLTANIAVEAADETAAIGAHLLLKPVGASSLEEALVVMGLGN